MPGVEDYHKYPGRKLETALDLWGWKRIDDGLWEKGQSRLYVDHVGVFLYRVKWVTPKSGWWRKTHGLAHNRIFPNDRLITFRDLSTLNLLTGEWNELH